jgi:hypothetical protein
MHISRAVACVPCTRPAAAPTLTVCPMLPGPLLRGAWPPADAAGPSCAGVLPRAPEAATSPASASRRRLTAWAVAGRRWGGGGPGQGRWREHGVAGSSVMRSQLPHWGVLYRHATGALVSPERRCRSDRVPNCAPRRQDRPRARRGSRPPQKAARASSPPLRTAASAIVASSVNSLGSRESSPSEGSTEKAWRWDSSSMPSRQRTRRASAVCLGG